LQNALVSYARSGKIVKFLWIMKWNLHEKKKKDNTSALKWY